jgi:hypothetical protein
MLAHFKGRLLALHKNTGKPEKYFSVKNTLAYFVPHSVRVKNAL